MIIIPNLAIAGYRSFGREPQYFDQFAKINLFIGQNNAGKSNVLRFLSEVYPQLPAVLKRKYLRKQIWGQLSLNILDQHRPEGAPLLFGTGENSKLNELSPMHRWICDIKDSHRRTVASQYFSRVIQEKARIDGKDICWTMFDTTKEIDTEAGWLTALKILSHREADALWSILSEERQGYRVDPHSNVIKQMVFEPVQIKAQLIPAIRRIGVKGSASDSFDGTGIIDRLAKLQNPDVHNQQDREQFDEITDFLRDVVDRPDAVLEIPYERDTIHVHMDGKVLPIESLGTGIHEVVILAAAATVLSEHVVCIEEPELHLNPILQRKLIRYLAAHTNNQYFITTHSNVLMDVPEAISYQAGQRSL